MELHEIVLRMMADMEYGVFTKPENIYVGRKEYRQIAQSDHFQRNGNELMFCGLNVFVVNVESHLKVA